MAEMDDELTPGAEALRSALRDSTPPRGAREAAVRAALSVYDQLYGDLAAAAPAGADERPGTAADQPGEAPLPANVIPLRRHVRWMKVLTAAAAALVGAVVIGTIVTRPRSDSVADQARTTPAARDAAGTTEAAAPTAKSKVTTAETAFTEVIPVEPSTAPVPTIFARSMVTVRATQPASVASNQTDAAAPAAPAAPAPTPSSTTGAVAGAAPTADAITTGVPGWEAVATMRDGRVVAVDDLAQLRQLVRRATAPSEAAPEATTLSAPQPACPADVLTLPAGSTATYLGPVVFRGVPMLVFLDSGGSLHLVRAATCTPELAPVPLDTP